MSTFQERVIKQLNTETCEAITDLGDGTEVFLVHDGAFNHFAAIVRRIDTGHTQLYGLVTVETYDDWSDDRNEPFQDTLDQLMHDFISM